MADFNETKKYVEELLKQNFYSETNQMDDPVLAYKHHIARVAKALETNGARFFIVNQIFKSMNPGPVGTGKILNPITPFGPPPGAEGLLTDNADIPLASMTSRPQVNLNQNSPGASQRWEQNKKLNLFTDDNNSNDHYYVDPSSLGSNNSSDVEVVPGVSVTIPDFSKIFEQKTHGPDFNSGEFGKLFWKPKSDVRQQKSADYRRKESMLLNDDAFFSQEELEEGFLTPELHSLQGVEDSTNYLPFFLEDMRSGGKRIYFRAFFKNLRETISPNWTTENYFGRVDPVGIYLNTSRQISVSFAVVAFSPQGFTAMWRKMNQLSKLLYPTFKNGVIAKAPVCRLRIGDVVCDEAGAGLTGYISSPLELDYSDSPWEISEWIGFSPIEERGKAPMMINASFSFQVIHERNPSIDEDFNFDTTFFRRIGGLQEFPNQGTSDSSSDGESVGGLDFEDEEL